MWDERFAEVCRLQPDLVAVYESAHGRLGLLRGQSLTPMESERRTWLSDTRAAASRVRSALRAAGFTGATVVLQWLPPVDAARIVARWVRRWDGDSARRAQLVAALEAAVTDSGTLDQAGLDALKAWYEAMASCWLAIQPVRRRRLVLQTHVWIADRVLTDPVTGPGLALRELGPGGSLARALAHLIPRAERTLWTSWVASVRAELERALRASSPTQAWARWLFMIPYNVPAPQRPEFRLLPGGAPAGRLA
jgi:hypothetical protein